MGAQGATCFHTLSTAARDLSKAQWDAERFGQLCTQAKNFADLKALVEKLCNQSGRCDYDKVDAFFEHVENHNR